MIACPNKNSPEWKALVEGLGELEAYKAFLANGEEVPDMEQVRQLTGNIQGRVNFNLKVIYSLLSNKVREPGKNFQGFLNDLRNVPKDQLQLLKDTYTQGMSKGELIASLLANYGYSIEINTAKDKFEDIKITGDPNWFHIAPEYKTTESPTQHYANLTVPGGTNYTENEIATPLITPSIKGHAQFATDKGIGWFRGDDRQINLGGAELSEEYAPDIEQLSNGKWEVSYMPITGGRKLEFFRTEQEAKDFVKTITKTSNEKTRRILEVQSDLFQKGRDKKDLVSKRELTTKQSIISYKGNTYDIGIEVRNGQVYEDNYRKNGESITHAEYYAAIAEYESWTEKNKLNSNENQFLQLLNKNNNWVTFFVKSIIQDTTKQTITEVQESDVEAKVKELEKEGLLEIDCKGKLKAEKGLQTNFTKGGRWKIYEIFEGKSHKQGGIDINIKNNQISFTNKNGSIKAKYGLVISKDN